MTGYGPDAYMTSREITQSTPVEKKPTMAELEATISTFGRYHELDEQNREIILDALCEKFVRENPQPLTLEQLRERDGKPVWITSGKDAVCAYSGWAIVGRYYDDTVALYVPDNVYYEVAIKHGTIIVYDYPPREEHNGKDK